MNREQAKQEIRQSWQILLKGVTSPAKTKVNGKTSYVCPICGHGAHGDGLTNNPKSADGNGLKCFGCGFSGDIIDLYQKQTGKDYSETLQELAGRLNITIDNKQAPAIATPAGKPAQDPAGAPAWEYLASRGISRETATAYGISYKECETFNLDAEGNKTGCKWRALIIPTGKDSFVARNIDTPQEPAQKNRYRKKGASIIFNSKALYNSDKPVFIVEGELDALSIIEAGGHAVGMGSTSNKDQLVKMLKSQPATQPLILALDQDEQGRKAEEALKAELTALQVPFYCYNPYGSAKDANEALTADKEAFKAEIATAERAQEIELEAIAEAQKEEYLKTSAAACIEDLHRTITESADTPAISTGFENLDGILEGGLYEGLYILGAISSLGKTTLALQIADQIAEQGTDVLIFSLEMAKTELMAKSISRLTFLQAEDKRQAKSMRGIIAGSRYSKYSQTEKDLIDGATQSYLAYAGHIFIHEGVGDIGIEKVKEIVSRHITLTGNKPVVIIDYVQILAPYDLRASDKQNTDKAVLELKRMSRDYKIPVLGISSFNRDSYKGNGNRGKVGMTDYKESGAIEYSADVLIGLEFAGAGSSDYDEKAEKKKNPREIRLVILKNRNGKAWETADFYYYPVFNYYQEQEPEIYDWDDTIGEAETAADIFAGMRDKGKKKK